MTRSKILQILFIAVIIGITTSSNLFAQNYRAESNTMNPDTLRGDQKMIFEHFVKWSSKEMEKLESRKLRDEFEKMGITLNNVYRLRKALSFVRIKLTHHKKSCENWKSFRYLNPAENKE